MERRSIPVFSKGDTEYNTIVALGGMRYQSADNSQSSKADYSVDVSPQFAGCE